MNFLNKQLITLMNPLLLSKFYIGKLIKECVDYTPISKVLPIMSSNI